MNSHYSLNSEKYRIYGDGDYLCLISFDTCVVCKIKILTNVDVEQQTEYISHYSNRGGTLELDCEVPLYINTFLKLCMGVDVFHIFQGNTEHIDQLFTPAANLSVNDLLTEVQKKLYKVEDPDKISQLLSNS